jgi:N-acyl-phosphatidylethanolamine-hydrolysing phospholipase D
VGGLLRWAVVERLTRSRAADPDPAAAFPRAVPAFVAPRAGPLARTATWVGHSSFLLQLGGWNVLTDPVWGERVSPVTFAGPRRYTAPGVALDALPPIDLVLVSHDHYDHLDAPTVRALAARHPAARWIVPLGVDGALAALGVRPTADAPARVRALDWWETAAAGPLDVTAVPAQHFSGRGVTGRDATLWAGFAVRVRGGAASDAVLYAGDTGLHPEFAAIGRRCGPFALALLPIGAYAPRWFMRPVHCDPDDALAAYAALVAGARAADATAAAPVLGGMHFGTFRLTDEPTDEPPRRVRAAWAAAGHAAERLWDPAPRRDARVGGALSGGARRATARRHRCPVSAA